MIVFPAYSWGLINPPFFAQITSPFGFRFPHLFLQRDSALLFAMLMIFEMFSVVDTKSDVCFVLPSIPFWPST